MRHLFLALPLMLFAAAPALALDGVNTETGDTVTVEDGTTFTEGDTVAVFDANGNEMDLQVQDVTDGDGTTDVDFVNPDTGDAMTISFEKK